MSFHDLIRMQIEAKFDPNDMRDQHSTCCIIYFFLFRFVKSESKFDLENINNQMGHEKGLLLRMHRVQNYPLWIRETAFHPRITSQSAMQGFGFKGLALDMC